MTIVIDYANIAMTMQMTIQSYKFQTLGLKPVSPIDSIELNNQNSTQDDWTSLQRKVNTSYPG